jgi:hypothetical protein
MRTRFFRTVVPTRSGERRWGNDVVMMISGEVVFCQGC